MIQAQRRVIGVLCCLAVLLSIAQKAFAGAHLSKASGIVQWRSAISTQWAVVKTLPHDVAEGDTVRTGARASASLAFDDGSRVDLAANANFTLEETGAQRSSLKLNFGRLKAFVQKIASRRFEVRTPTAVCSVRGTEFQVDVENSGRTTVNLYAGLLGVEDNKGQQVLLHPNERVSVDIRGLDVKAMVPGAAQTQSAQFHALMQREMSLDMSKEEVQAAAAREIKLAEYQQGKALMDAFGQRVRLEEYIIRPQPDQFKLVVLNERSSRFDYFYYLGTFNAALPTDLSVALRQLSGSVGTAPDYYLTAFETGRSNTKDSMVEMAQGGHPVDVNNNGDASDDVKLFFDSSKNSFTDVAGQSVYQTLFDRYGFYINGNLKYGWTGGNLQSYAQAASAASADPITGAALAAALPARSVSVTFPDADQIHQIIYESYSDGTFTQWDNYIINDAGRIATISDFQSARSGASYKERLLDFNYEQVITASEFGGRKIDLVVEPKILVQSGLIQ